MNYSFDAIQFIRTATANKTSINWQQATKQNLNQEQQQSYYNSEQAPLDKLLRQKQRKQEELSFIN